ncbi:MAG: SIR2 family protein [Bryobacteraceae bacterium]
MVKELTLAEAVDQIRGASKRRRWPFFFMVGAGISCPSVPTAAEIVAECKRLYSRAQPPEGLSPMTEYSWWLEHAFPNAGDRQDYFEGLIGGKPITQASLHLAHLLLDGEISKLVITTNFDDFISRALDLFGTPHVRCDHPDTIQRIDHTADRVQLVHVHGSYLFYDCCNLEGEIEPRAQQSAVSTFSMRQFLEGLLNARSPLVIGYSGWEKDVFMSALHRRLATELRFNVYWFCYRRSEVDSLPQELRDHPNVTLVLPPAPAPTEDTGAKRLEDDRLMPAVSVARTSKTALERERPEGLDAAKVFQEMIQILKLEAPPLTRDPLGFYACHLRASLPPDDTYLIQSVIGKIERAAALLAQSKQKVDKALEKVEDSIRRSQYREAIQAADVLEFDELESERLADLIESLWRAAVGLNDNSPEELRAYDRVVSGVDVLARNGAIEPEMRSRQAQALLYKGVTFGQLGRSEEEIVVYDGLVERFGQDTEPGVREQVAGALRNKGVTLGQLGRGEGRLRRRGGALRSGHRARRARAGSQRAPQQGRHARATRPQRRGDRRLRCRRGALRPGHGARCAQAGSQRALQQGRHAWATRPQRRGDHGL